MCMDPTMHHSTIPETSPLGSITLNSGRSPCILHSGDHRGGESTGFPSHPCVSQTIRRPTRSKGGLWTRPPAWDSASWRSGTSHGGSTARRTNSGNQRAPGTTGTTTATARLPARTLWMRDSIRTTGGMRKAAPEAKGCVPQHPHPETSSTRGAPNTTGDTR